MATGRLLPARRHSFFLVLFLTSSLPLCFSFPGRNWVHATSLVASLEQGRSANDRIRNGSLESNAARVSLQASSFQISFEYCTGCRWGLRASWMAQELLTTFADEPSLQAVTLIPNRSLPGGQFVVTCRDASDSTLTTTLWDRSEKGGFPEIKELKQLVRNEIAPGRFLGHSDVADRQEAPTEETSEPVEDLPEKEELEFELPTIHSCVSPHVSIAYCPGCRWLLRSAYFSQELMTTFDQEINSLTLLPSRPPVKGGTFCVHLDGELLWDRATQGGFPETKVLKQAVRDKLSPTKDLGHSDVKPVALDTLDEDDAEEARKYFGVL